MAIRHGFGRGSCTRSPTSFLGLGRRFLLEQVDVRSATTARSDCARRVRDPVTVLLPVLGVFTIADGKIAKWCDYFEAATVTPLTDALAA